jgi:hypothetical protein
MSLGDPIESFNSLKTKIDQLIKCILDQPNSLSIIKIINSLKYDKSATNMFPASVKQDAINEINRIDMLGKE